MPIRFYTQLYSATILDILSSSINSFGQLFEAEASKLSVKVENEKPT